MGATSMLILIDKGVSAKEIDINELRRYVEWLSDYRGDIYYWNRLVSIGAAARQCIRIEGIHINIVDSFEQAISSIPMGLQELQFADRISLFLMEQSKGLKPEELFVGSTEVIESLFGKIKFMECEQTAFGFTSLVLASMACVGPTDDKTIGDAIRAVKLSDIDEWAAKEIGKSVQSQRKQLKKIVSKLTIKMGQEVSGFLERVRVGF